VDGCVWPVAVIKKLMSLSFLFPGPEMEVSIIELVLFHLIFVLWRRHRPMPLFLLFFPSHHGLHPGPRTTPPFRLDGNDDRCRPPLGAPVAYSGRPPFDGYSLAFFLAVVWSGYRIALAPLFFPPFCHGRISRRGCTSSTAPFPFSFFFFFPLTVQDTVRSADKDGSPSPPPPHIRG